MATLPPTPTDSTPTPTSPEEFQIFVKVLTGKTITLLIITDTLVEDLTELIRAAHGVFSNQQRLIFAGRQMWAGKRLVEYGVVKVCLRLSVVGIWC
jgi:hypothetical protein